MTQFLDESARSTGTARHRPRKRLNLRKPTFLEVVLGVPIIFMIIMYGYPVFNVLRLSVTDPTLGFENYVRALTSPTILQVLWITFRIAIITAALAALIGLPVAYFMTRLPPRQARYLTMLIVIPFWTSVLVRSFAWIVLLGDGGVVANFLSIFTGSTQGILYTEPAVILSMVHILLPYTILITKGALDQIDIGLVRAARTLGAGPIRSYTKVYLPIAMPAVLNSAVLVFVLSLGYYITPALIGGAEQTMIAMLIERNISVVIDWGLAATLSVILLVVSIIVLGVVQKFTKVKGATIV